MPLTKDQFVAASNALPLFVDVACNELGGAVRLQRLTTAQAVEAGRFTSSLADENGDVTDPAAMTQIKADFVARCVVDGDGLSFLDDIDGRAMLAALPVGTLARLYNAGQQLCGLQVAVAESKKN